MLKQGPDIASDIDAEFDALVGIFDSLRRSNGMQLHILDANQIAVIQEAARQPPVSNLLAATLAMLAALGRRITNDGPLLCMLCQAKISALSGLGGAMVALSGDVDAIELADETTPIAAGLSAPLCGLCIALPAVLLRMAVYRELERMWTAQAQQQA